MITINHGFSAYVCGRVAGPLLRPLLGAYAPVSGRAMGWALFLGGLMPDADIVSKSMGRAAYFSGAWYSHRQASHSLLGTLLLALLCAAVLYRPLTAWDARRERGAWLWMSGCFWAGALVHVAGDLFTPGRPMPVLWPLTQRFGAWSHIGWFTPYLLWLFVATILLGWLYRRAAMRLAPLRPWRGAALWLLYAAALWRWVQFTATSRYDSGWQWMELQRALLPEAMVNPVTQGISRIWFWLTG